MKLNLISCLKISAFTWFFMGSLNAQVLNAIFDVTSSTSTSVTMDIKLYKTSPEPMALSAITTYLAQPTPIPAFTGTTVPTWVEGSGFTGLANPAPSLSTVRVRATQAPIGSLGGAVSITAEDALTAQLYGTITVTSTTPIPYPVTLDPNASFTAVVYQNGANTPTTIVITADPFVINAPLPIKLSNFDAIAIGKHNRLNWSTSSEYNNDVQIVEASKDGASNWRQVAKVKSRNSATGSSYEVFDNNPGLLTYYRIHSIDLDGREEYSYVISVQCESIITSRLRGISPIPANDVLNLDLEIASDMNVEYRIIDAAGKVVAANMVILTQGNNVQTIDIATLASGSYTVILSGDDLVTTEQFVKQ